MTGYQSKKAAAQDKLEQWDTPSEAFNDWWDSDYDDSTNPYEKDTFAYWAWAGWQAALAQPAQEPVCPECKAGVLYECVACSSNNYPAQPAQEPFGYLSIGGNPIFQKEKPEIGRWETLYTAPPQHPWVGLTDEEMQAVVDAQLLVSNINVYFKAIEAKLKEKNNG